MLLVLLLLPHLVDTYSPDLVLSKQAKVQGDDGTIYHVNITVRHSPTSLNDSFNVTIEDQVHHMDVISLRLEPPVVASTAHYSSSLSPRKISGLVPHLPLKDSVSLVYFAKFQRTRDEVRSESKAKLTWASVSGRNVFGPKYGESSCVVKQFHSKNSSLGNFGFIILAVVLGILCGCLIAYLLVQCLKRYPSTKKYLFHSEQAADAGESNPIDKTMIVPVYYDKPVSTEDPRKMPQREYNIFKKFRHSRPTNAATEYATPEVSNETLWRWNLFKQVGENCMSALNQTFNRDYISLLEFTLDVWMNLWKSRVRSHIDQVLSDSCANKVKKDSFAEKVDQMFLVEKRDSRDINDFVKKVSGTITKHYTSGESLLMDAIGASELKDNSVRENATENIVLERKEKRKQLTKKQEDVKQSSVDGLKTEFTQLSGELFEAFYHVSMVFINIHLATVSTAFLLVLLKKSIGMLHYWMKYSVARQTDALKRKGLVTDEMDSAFQERFKEELNQLVTHLESMKSKSIKTVETSVLLEYLGQKRTLREQYTSVLSNSTAMNMNSALQVGIDSAKFELSEEFSDSYEKLVLEENIFKDYHSTFLSDMTHAMNIFISRMKSHADDIHNNRTTIPEQVNDLGSFVGGPVELLKVSEVNHFGILISDLNTKNCEVIKKLKDFMNTSLSSIQNHRNSWRNFSTRTLMEKADKKFDQISLRQLLLKCHVQSHSPLSWERCLYLVNSSSKSCISAFYGQVISSQCVPEVQCGLLVDAVVKSPAAQLTTPLLDKIDLISEGIFQEIDALYQSAKTFVRKFELDLSSVTRDLQKGNYLELFQHQKRIKQYELLLDITCSILSDIIQAEVKKVENILHSQLTIYRKSILKTLKTGSSTITKESETEVRSKLDDDLQNYMSTCSIFVPENQGAMPMQDLVCDVKELMLNMFEMGRQFKCLENRLSYLSSCVSTNCLLLCDLLPLNLIPMEQSHFHLRCILCLCQQDLDDSYKLTWNNGTEVTMEYLLKSMLNLRSDGKSDDLKGI